MKAGVPWGACRITPYRDLETGATFALQMFCTHPQHKSCSKQRSVKKEGYDVVLRRLKLWVLEGFGRPDAGAHKEDWARVLAIPVCELPTEASLDERCPDSWDWLAAFGADAADG